MPADPTDVIIALFQRWQAGDVAGVLAWCDDSICYVLHQQPHRSRFSGELRGKMDVGEYLTDVCKEWQFLKIVPGQMTVRGDVVRNLASFQARHRSTGEKIEGVKRQEWLVIDGRVARCDEYQDANMIGSFLHCFG